MDNRSLRARALTAVAVVIVLVAGGWYAYAHRTASLVQAVGLHVDGNRLVATSAAGTQTPFVVKGVSFDAITLPDQVLAKASGEATDTSDLDPQVGINQGLRAHKEFVANGIGELDAIKAFGGNTAKFLVSQYGLDPQSKLYSEAYVDEVKSAVALAESRGLYVMLEDDPFGSIPTNLSGQSNDEEMASASTERADVELAQLFGSDTSVMLSLYHKPILDVTPANWQLWLSGGQGEKDPPVVGMQTIVNEMRSAGSKNVIIVNALDDGVSFSGMPAVTDPLNDLAYGALGYFHPQSDTPDEWQANIGALADAGKVVIITEWTQETGGDTQQHNWCATLKRKAALPLTLPQDFVNFLAAHHIGLVAYSADAPGTLWTDYAGTPTTYDGFTCAEQGGGPGTVIKQFFASVVPAS